MSNPDPQPLEDQSLSEDKLTRLDEDERREKVRNRAILGGVFVLGVLVALWVGANINSSQTEAKTSAKSATVAQGNADQAQAEKYTLAQQVAAACAGGTLDKDVQTQLCRDAQQITKEGPQGVQGIPGVQGVQGVQGIPGKTGATGPVGPAGKDSTAPGPVGKTGPEGDPGPVGPAGAAGKDGVAGPAGPAGKDGKDGSVGPTGPAGKDGQPPASWIVFDEQGNETERCQRAANFDPASPTYTCTSSTPVTPPAAP